MGIQFARSALAVFVLCTFAFPLSAQTEIEEHWSGYDYPKQVPAGVNFHLVADGDTLWAIAAQYMKNPLLWPQIYQANDYIKDPNLIYPGDPIILTVGVVVDDQSITDSMEGDPTATSSESGDVMAELDEFSEASDAAAGESDDQMEGSEEFGSVSEVTDYGDLSGEFVILPAGDRADMECTTYLHPAEKSGMVIEPDAARIYGGEIDLLSAYGHHDIIYINQGLDHGIEPGTVYSARRQGDDVYTDPEVGKSTFVGVAVDQSGLVKILAVQEDNATAIVTRSCFEIRNGDFLVPYEQEPIPLITELPVVDRFQAFNMEGSGHIVSSEDDLQSFGKGHVTNINLGTETSNVAPGDLFVIYRPNPNSQPKKGVFLPEIYLGHGVALKTNAKSTVMKVIDGMREIGIGDRVVPFSQGSPGE